MALIIGTRCGPYEITAPLGAGGMGEVYRARDSRLKREVALKILPDSFAADPERLARFQREAEVLASLNHPNIAAIYGLEERALVLELVEGDTLADRIARGAIPIDEALPIARQIAEALEAAHEHGIIHRDLKPANIKVTPDGLVKVLDFGLAKLAAQTNVGRDFSPAGSKDPAYMVSQSPTITSPAMMTGAGMILGTAAYMSPEQAKGREADKRSDIWAFGAVLFEMLTGRRAFEGDDVSDTMAAVLRAEPDWTAVPATTPRRVRSLIEHCLQKDRKRRVPDIAIARFELAEELAAEGLAADTSSAPAGMRSRERMAWACVAAVVLAAGATVAYVTRTAPAADEPRIVFSIEPPDDTVFPGDNTFAAEPAISPDGRQAVFVVRTPAGVNQLAVRTLSSPDARLLNGTEVPLSPFWSPDGRTIAFFSNGQLKRVDIAGGTSETVAGAPGSVGGAAGAGGAWSTDGTVLFTGPTGALVRVQATGGEPTPVTMLDAGRKESSHQSPWFLPDGRRFLFLSKPGNAVFLASLDGGERRELLRAESKAIYSSTGHLLFIRANTLMAQPFDVNRGDTAGAAFRVADNVGFSQVSARGAFSVSDTGVLVHWNGSETISAPTWFDRTGKVLGRIGEEGRYTQVAIAPDSAMAALSRVGDDNLSDTWLLDLARGISTRFTFERSVDPIWSPDGRFVAFTRTGSPNRIFRKAVDGGEELRVWEGELRYSDGWSSDGKAIIYHVAGRIGTLPLTGDAPATVWLDTRFQKDGAHPSPDGRWIAYQSDEAGQPDVYVGAFPGPGQTTRVSTSGGGSAQWRADGRELFYLTPGGELMGVPVTPGAQFAAGVPQPLFKTPITSVFLGLDQYDVTGDGQRFLILAPVGNTRQDPITVVVNWLAGLERP